MGEIERRLEKIEYHQKLLLAMIQTQNFPVYELIVKKDLAEDEVEKLFNLCDELTIQYEQQKEEGFVYFTPLLAQFVRLINKKLDPEETINAFLGQKIYVSLMEVLKKTLAMDEKKL